MQPETSRMEKMFWQMVNVDVWYIVYDGEPVLSTNIGFRVELINSLWLFRVVLCHMQFTWKDSIFCIQISSSVIFVSKNLRCSINCKFLRIRVLLLSYGVPSILDNASEFIIIVYRIVLICVNFSCPFATFILVASRQGICIEMCVKMVC